MKRLGKFVTNHPVFVIVLVFAITAFFGYYATRVEMTTDIKDFFPDTDERVQQYNEVEEMFGSAEYIMVSMESNDIFTVSMLEEIDNLSTNLSEIKGVKDVRSLTTVDQIVGSEFGLELKPLIPGIPDEEEMDEVKEKVLSDEMYAGTLVSYDGEAALIVIEVNPNSSSVEVAERVENVLDSHKGSARLLMTGTPVLNRVLAESMKADLKVLLPVVLIVIGLILFYFFKRIRGVVLPFITVLVSLIWTLGLMGLLNKPISPLNAVMPIILISLGNAYCIYLLNRQREEVDKGHKKRKAAYRSVVSVGLAILMAGGTTMAGFASNILSDITLMKDFGIFTSFGVGVALLISLTLIPAFLSITRTKKTNKERENRGIMTKGINLLSKVAVRNSRLILTITLVIVLLAGFGMTRLEIDSNFFNFFDDNSKPKMAYNFVKEKFSGSESVEIVVSGNIKDAETLKAMKSFQEELYETGLVGQPTSLANIMEKTNKAMHESNEEYHVVPDNSDLIAQYLLLIEMNDLNYLEKFTTMDYANGRIQALVKDTSSEGTQELMKKIDELEEEYFAPLDLKVTTTGIIVLIDALAYMIINGQIKGIAFALITVFLIVFALLRSFQGSIFSVILISLVILINFGVMGWTGIPLDIVTVLISSIGIGVGIDYSIHIFSRYLEEVKSGKNVDKAIIEAISTTGRSIINNAGAIIGGFIILVFSSFPPFRYFGLLVSLIMLAAALGALLFIPASIKFMSDKSLKTQAKSKTQESSEKEAAR